MVVYSINDLEKLSGIKAHTLRVWEKRYGIVTPKRTETNIRYYDDRDLELILNISVLRRKGYKISKIAKLSVEEISRQAAELSNLKVEFLDDLDTLTLAMLELNEYKFNKILKHNIEQKGFYNAIEEVVYPFLDKISVMWMAGSIKTAHESFVVHLIKRKCIAEIDKLKYRQYNDAPRFVIYLPENENQELSLLYVHYLLKAQNISVTNLGTNVPILDVVDACRIIHPDYIYTMISNQYDRSSVDAYISDMLEYIPTGQVILSGYQSAQQEICKEPRLICYNSINELKQKISSIVKSKEN